MPLYRPVPDISKQSSVELLLQGMEELKQQVSALRMETMTKMEELKNEVTTLKQQVSHSNTASGEAAAKNTAVNSEVSKKPEETKPLQQYESPLDWPAVYKYMEATLDKSSAAYKQLLDITAGNARPMYTIGSKGYKKLVLALVSAGLSVDIADSKDKYTMLHAAADGGHVVLVQLLLNSGASCETRTSLNNTPIMLAAWRNHLSAVQLLNQRGADVNAAGQNNWSSLHWAAGHGHQDVVRYLVQSGADTAARDNHNKTALDYARTSGYPGVASYLQRLPQ